MDHLPESGATSVEPERVRLEAVVARISTPVVHGRGSEKDGFNGAELAVNVEWSDGAGGPQIASELAGRLLDVHLDRTLGLGLVIAATTALAATIWNGDLQSALTCGLVVATLAILRILDHRARFSFGEGFVGYRPDIGWPRGVQEDDDFHWHWCHEAGAAEPITPKEDTGGMTRGAT